MFNIQAAVNNQGSSERSFSAIAVHWSLDVGAWSFLWAQARRRFPVLVLEFDEIKRHVLPIDVLRAVRDGRLPAGLAGLGLLGRFLPVGPDHLELRVGQHDE